jgi:hypothetical protein
LGQTDEATWCWRTLNIEEHRDFFSAANIIRVIKSRRLEWAENVTGVGEMSSAYRVLMGKHEGNKSLARPRHRWEDSIKTDLK